MTIKRYIATSDNTITNAFKEDLSTRGTGSNMGASDILEIFSISGQQSSGSIEKSRALVQFDISSISSDRSAGTIPASGSVSFYLKLCNAEHTRTTPKNFKILVQAVSQSWQEGNGLDMENYTDLTYDQIGSNWIKRSAAASWDSPGGDYHNYPDFTKSLDSGLEDLEVNVTELVEEWLDSTKENYGFGIRLSGSFESGSQSYYTKKFFARTSEFYYKRPRIEARWDASLRDDRGYFYASSSLATESDNVNTIYLYNYIRGRLKNIPVVDDGAVYVDLYDSIGAGSSKKTLCVNTPATGGYVSRGVYSASLCVDTTASILYDVWHNGSGTQYHTGTISVLNFRSQNYSTDDRYVISISNMKNHYSDQETARFRLYTRPKAWSPSIYTKAVNTPENVIISSASYEIFRVIDNYTVIPFGTGSTIHTGLSYDVSGNYFDVDLSMLEADYSYGIRLAFYNDSFSSWQVQPYEFKFKVRSDEY